MRGVILGVHGERGILTDAEQKRLEFPLSEWRSGGAPSAGQAVDFVEEGGEARAVYAVPAGASMAAGGSPSGSYILGAVGLVCLAVGFFIPFLPTVAAFVLGVLGAQAAQRGNDDTALLLSRISWIGALILLTVGILALTAVIALFGGLIGLGHFLTYGLGPGDL